MNLSLFLGGCYVTNQALHQNDLYNTRIPIDEAVESDATSKQTKLRLQHVKKVLVFSKKEGLNTKGAYRYLINTGKSSVSYLVQAAHADRLKSVTWWFPIVGSVPYRGYFLKEDRDLKAQELRKSGYDVHEGRVGAFSSLGWFEDPIFSSMLRRNLADLTDLIIHELLHRTLWIPGSVKFNENFAEYVATTLTPKFLATEGLQDKIDSYKQKREDRKLFKVWLKDLRKELKGLYKKRKKLSRAELLKSKEALFSRFKEPPLKPEFKTYDYVGRRDWNNASVLGASLYSPDTERFNQAHKCIGGGAMHVFIEALRIASEQTDDGFKALDKMCHPSETAVAP